MRIVIIALLLPVSLMTESCNLSSDEEPNNKQRTKLRFRLALELKPETKIWEVSNLFRQELEKASPEHGIEEGEIAVDFYDQGSIGTERQLLEASFFGVVEVVQVNTAVVTTIEPSFAILNLPYLFENEEHHQSALNGEIGGEFLNMLTDHDLIGLGFYSAGLRSMFYKFPDSRPCAVTPEEFRGLKIRVMESRTMIATINSMGASASPLPFSELYQGIKTGVVDGAENSPKIFASYRYDEAGCNCFTLTEHSTDQHILVANYTWLQSLQPKYRNRINEVAIEIIPKYNAIWQATTQSAMKSMTSANVRINAVRSKDDFRTAVAPVADQFFDMYPEVSKELYARISQHSLQKQF